MKLSTRNLLHASCLTAGAFALLAAGPVSAATETVYWDGTTTTGDADGGDGSWGGATTNWDTALSGGSDVQWDGDASGDDTAVFGGTAGTVTLTGPITLQNLTINDLTSTNRYTITGSTLNFGVGGTIAASSNTSGPHFSDHGFIESAITGAPTVNLSGMGGNRQLAFNPTSGSVTLGSASGSGVLTMGGSTTGNSWASSTAKTRINSGEWTLTGLASAYEHFIYGGDIIVEGTMRNNNRSVNLAGGTLHYNNAAAVYDFRGNHNANEDFWFNGGNLDNTSGAAITTSTYNPDMTWTKDFTFFGSNGANSDLYLGDGSVFLHAGDRTVTVQHADTTLSLAGLISDKGTPRALSKAGDGTLALSGSANYTGATNVDAGTLTIDGDHSAATGLLTVASGAALGGNGTLGGDVLFDSGANFLFSTTDTLTANGSSVDMGTLGIANLIGLDSSVAAGTYTLIDGSAAFDFDSVSNLGSANSVSIGGGKVAYLQEGSLQVVVAVPEPSSLALLGLGGLLISRRRRVESN